MIRGLDVSAIQGAVPWQAAYDAGARFVWCRSYVGNERARDSRVLANLKGARDAGLAVGGYFFAFPLPKLQPEAQVDLWAKSMEVDGDLVGRARGELPPALDLEWPPPEEREKSTGRLIDTWAKWGCSAEQILMWGAKAAIRMRAIWGCWPALYTYPYFWQRITNKSVVGATALADAFEVYAQCPLWIADYRASGRVPGPAERPHAPAPWAGTDAPVIWQHDGNGGLRLPNGVDVDWNVIPRDEDLERLTQPAEEQVLVPPGVDTVLARQTARTMMLEEQIAAYRRERVAT